MLCLAFDVQVGRHAKASQTLSRARAGAAPEDSQYEIDECPLLVIRLAGVVDLVVRHAGPARRLQVQRILV